MGWDVLLFVEAYRLLAKVVTSSKRDEVQAGGDGDGGTEVNPSEDVSKVELAKVELEAHTNLYNQAMEALKTVPTRAAPVIAFSAAIIGFVATSLVKEFGPRVIAGSLEGTWLVVGLWTVGFFSFLSLVLAGVALTGVSSVVYVPAHTTIKELLGTEPKIGTYMKNGQEYIKQLLEKSDYDAKSAVVMYQAALKQQQAISLLRSVRNARRWIIGALTCVVLSLLITVIAFIFCVTEVGFKAASENPAPTLVSAPIHPVFEGSGS